MNGGVQCQCVLRVLVMVLQSFDWGNPDWIEVLVYAVTITTVWSGIDYVVTWGRRARERE